jgi:uncharacterized phage protein (predicted DNA packaging)
MALVDRLANADSPDYITLDRIKAWLRIEHNLDDDLLNNCRLVAVNEADNYTQNDFTHVDENGNTVDDPIPFNMTLGCMMYISYLYENRGNVTFEYGSGTPLTITYIKLWTPYKKLVGL